MGIIHSLSQIVWVNQLASSTPGCDGTTSGSQNSIVWVTEFHRLGGVNKKGTRHVDRENDGYSQHKANTRQGKMFARYARCRVVEALATSRGPIFKNIPTCSLCRDRVQVSCSCPDATNFLSILVDDKKDPPAERDGIPVLR